MKENKPSLHPEIEKLFTWIGHELSGEDPRLAEKFGKLRDLGIGRVIQAKDPDNPHDYKVIGISLPLGDEKSGHILAFTNGFIGRFEPNLSDKDNKQLHVNFFSPQNKPIIANEAWGMNATDVSRKVRMNPEIFFSQVTHSNFDPDQQYEVEELFCTALENAFILKENEEDGKKHGIEFLNRQLTVFENKQHNKLK